MSLFTKIQESLKRLKNIKLPTVQQKVGQKVVQQKPEKKKVILSSKPTASKPSSVKTSSKQIEKINSNQSESTRTVQNIKSVKTNANSIKPFDEKIVKDQARAIQIISTGNVKKKPVTIKLTEDGLIELASSKIAQEKSKDKTEEDIKKEIQTTREETVESEAEAGRVITEETEDSTVSFALTDTENTRKDIFLGPEELELQESQKPKILAMFEEDSDKNGKPDILNLVIRRLSSNDKVNIRVIGYDIYRKSVLEEDRFKKIQTVLPSDLSVPFMYRDSLSDMGLEKEEVFMFSDKSIETGKIYAYKVITKYDNDPKIVFETDQYKSLKDQITEKVSRVKNVKIGNESLVASVKDIEATRKGESSSKDFTSFKAKK